MRKKMELGHFRSYIDVSKIIELELVYLSDQQMDPSHFQC